MNGLNALFRERIGLPADEKIVFERLDHLLEKTARTFPFENLRLLDGRACPITESYLVNKLLLAKEGGLCYELNSLLYLFLAENGFDVVMTRGIVFNRDTEAYMTHGRSHIAILLARGERLYLVDTGFGANLPLMPVPLTGEIVFSRNGSFRIVREDGIHGDYRLEVKISHKDADWHIGYAFGTGEPLTDLTACEAVRKLVTEHPESTFNKRPLVTRLTEGGNITLTNDSITEWKDGTVTKESIDAERYKELLRAHFGL